MVAGYSEKDTVGLGRAFGIPRATRHCIRASDRKVRSVDRETVSDVLRAPLGLAGKG